jgi:hypothetical protein
MSPSSMPSDTAPPNSREESSGAEKAAATHGILAERAYGRLASALRLACIAMNKKIVYNQIVI